MRIKPGFILKRKKDGKFFSVLGFEGASIVLKFGRKKFLQAHHSVVRDYEIYEGETAVTTGE
jgi:hypothetical protein